jgi:hypothetical protein
MLTVDAQLGLGSSLLDGGGGVTLVGAVQGKVDVWLELRSLG